MASGNTLCAFVPALCASFPASNYATPDLRNNHPVLDFDGSTDEEAYFELVMPAHYGGGGIAIDLYVALTSATSGTSRWQTDIERINSAGPDLESDSFVGTFQSAGARQMERVEYRRSLPSRIRTGRRWTASPRANRFD